MKNLNISLRITIFFTLLLGLAYPLLVTGIARGLFVRQAGGDVILKEGQPVGATLIAQKFEKPEYFWPRPSAIDYNPLASGGSNLGQASADLQKTVAERRAKLLAANPGAGEPPQDLLFASASGLDPHISPTAARYQILRVAKARQIDAERVKILVEQSIADRQWGIFGEKTVNVLTLNMELDDIR